MTVRAAACPQCDNVMIRHCKYEESPQCTWSKCSNAKCNQLHDTRKDRWAPELPPDATEQAA